MAHEVIWLPQASDDLAEIIAHLESRSDTAAVRVTTAINDAMQKITSFPRSGRIIPEFDDPLRRETFVFEYRVMYRVEPNAVAVLRIVHGRRLLENVSGSFQETAQAEYRAS